MSSKDVIVLLQSINAYPYIVAFRNKKHKCARRYSNTDHYACIKSAAWAITKKHTKALLEVEVGQCDKLTIHCNAVFKDISTRTLYLYEPAKELHNQYSSNITSNIVPNTTKLFIQDLVRKTGYKFVSVVGNQIADLYCRDRCIKFLEDPKAFISK